MAGSTEEETMLKRSLILIGIVASLSLNPGCGGQQVHQNESMLEKNWGRSYEAAKYNQILNPDAGKDLSPVEGLDGAAAEAGVDKYRQSFQKAPAQQSYNLNLGNISGIGQK